MDKSSFDIEFYDLADGTKPAQDFIQKLLPKQLSELTEIVLPLHLNYNHARQNIQSTNLTSPHVFLATG